jgi:hypothetical protein
MTIASAIEIDETLSRIKPTAIVSTAHYFQFGIKAKLFLSFFSLAALTALASAVAWYVFRDIDRAVTRLTAESVPGIVTALSSAEKSAEIAATAPALVAAGTQEERVLEEKKLEGHARSLANLISQLIASNFSPGKASALSKIERETTAKIKELDVAVEKRHSHGLDATLTAVLPPGRFGATVLEGHRVTRFAEKPAGDGGYINGGFFVLNKRVLERIAGDDTQWETTPLESLAHDGQLAAYVHDGFWRPMDTLRDKTHLEELWASETAPWKVW